MHLCAQREEKIDDLRAQREEKFYVLHLCAQREKKFCPLRAQREEKFCILRAQLRLLGLPVNPLTGVETKSKLDGLLACWQAGWLAN